uniref:Uncharacterized protein n=1 Tax=viral metagenome TaxID=1070528 RepID=A0A6C0HTP2_9ZZZZ
MYKVGMSEKLMKKYINIFTLLHNEYFLKFTKGINSYNPLI